MVDFLKIIDFSKEVKENARLEDHLKKVAKDYTEQTKNDENYRQPVNDTDLSNMVIVTGLPRVPEEKLDKLQGFFKAKILPGLDVPIPEITFDIVNKEMVGNALLIFADQDTAKNAASKLNGAAFDNKHTMSACSNEDFDDMVNVPDEYSPPKFIPREDLQAWLLDQRFREQLLVRVQNRSYLQWFDHVAKTDQIFAQNTFKTEYGEVIKIEWSKSGSYLVTFHEDGFYLWGGVNFEKLNFFPHAEVRNVEFSADEQYVLSFNGTVNEAPTSENYIVWRVGSANKLRAFKATQNETWGSYKWNFDGTFIASFGNDLLNIYELPSMSRVMDPQTQKRSPLKVPSIQKIEWAPNKNLLCIAAYRPLGAKGDPVGKIYVIEIPSRLSIKWKTITWEVIGCDIHWENTGNKIVLGLKKLVKGKKTSAVVQIGEIRHTNITVEEHEFNDGKFVNVDDSGKKVAVLSQDPNLKETQGGGIPGYSVDIYRTDEEIRGKYFQKLGSFTDKPVSHVLWSPNGTFFALVNTDKFSAKIGYLEFGVILGNNLELIKSTRVAYMIYAAWDPSGRYLVTSSSKGQYTIWTGYGDAVIKDNFVEITQISWRPKPKLVLPAKVESEITSNPKKYYKKYEEEDDKIINEDKYKKEKMRKEQKEEFIKLLEAKKAAWNSTKDSRVKLVGFDEDNLTDLAHDEVIEGEEPVNK